MMNRYLEGMNRYLPLPNCHNSLADVKPDELPMIEKRNFEAKMKKADD